MEKGKAGNRRVDFRSAAERNGHRLKAVFAGRKLKCTWELTGREEGHVKHRRLNDSPVRKAPVMRAEGRTGLSFNRVEPRINSSLYARGGFFILPEMVSGFVAE